MIFNIISTTPHMDLFVSKDDVCSHRTHFWKSSGQQANQVSLCVASKLYVVISEQFLLLGVFSSTYL